MKRLFKLKYPKLFFLILTVVLAYFIFSNETTKGLVNYEGKEHFGYVFLFGSLFTFGFTTPFAIGYFLTYSTQNVLLNAIVGGVGAVIADLTIFKLIKFSFMDEFNKLKREKRIKNIRKMFDLHLPKKIKLYLSFIFAGIIIASPLPDEIGVSMLAGMTKIKVFQLAVLSFVFNSLGIAILLLL
jgi:hypothetical protein